MIEKPIRNIDFSIKTIGGEWLGLAFPSTGNAYNLMGTLTANGIFFFLRLQSFRADRPHLSTFRMVSGIHSPAEKVFDHKIQHGRDHDGDLIF